MDIAITGARGFIGSALTSFLQAQGHTVYPLKHPDEVTEGWKTAENKPLASLPSLDAAIHLAGEPVFGRWTAKKKRAIRDSRSLYTLSLCQELTQLLCPPKILIQGSAVGYYGSRGEEILEETAGAGEGFLASVCQETEAATEVACRAGLRVVLLRLGIVLASSGGILKKMTPPFRWGLGGHIGTGKQYMSWIALEDLLVIIARILCDNTLSGPVNAVSPHPVTNKQFVQTLAAELHRPAFFPLPAWALHLLFGEMADELLLSSTRAIPSCLLANGYLFAYPQLDGALRLSIC